MFGEIKLAPCLGYAKIEVLIIQRKVMSEHNTQDALDINLFAKVHEKVEKKSYKKLAFLGVCIGVAFAVGLGSITGYMHYRENVQRVEQQQALADAQDAQKGMEFYNIQIRKIDPASFAGFQAYLKANQTLYDSRVELVVSADRETEKAHSFGHSESSSSVAQILNDLNNDHKKNMEYKINTFSDLYARVMASQAQNIKPSVYKDFMSYYNNYQANVYTLNPKLDKALSDSLNSNLDNNKSDNEKNGTYQKFNSLTQEAISVLPKPKM